MDDPTDEQTVKEAISTVSAIFALGYNRYRNRRAVDTIKETHSDTQCTDNEGVTEISLDCAGD